MGGLPWSPCHRLLQCVQIICVVQFVVLSHLVMVQMMMVMVMVTAVIDASYMCSDCAAVRRCQQMSVGDTVRVKLFVVASHGRRTMVDAVRMMVVVVRCGGFGRVQRGRRLPGQIGEQLLATDVASVFLSHPIR